MNKEKKNFVLQKIILNSLFYVHFLSLYCAAKKENEPKERNRRLSKETVKCFIKDFAVTSYGQNLFKT